jgi:CRP/FNR family transcriptional regulator
MMNNLSVQKLIASAIVRSFAPGQIIVRPHEQARSVPLVLQGAIKVYFSPANADDEFVLYYLEADQYCVLSLLSAVNRTPARIYGIAETPCTIAFIPAEHFIATIATDHILFEQLLCQYHQRMEEILELVSTLRHEGLIGRLKELLSRKAHVCGSHTFRITHEEVAHELGTSRVVVSRLLKELERCGAVKLHRGSIEWNGNA